MGSDYKLVVWGCRSSGIQGSGALRIFRDATSFVRVLRLCGFRNLEFFFGWGGGGGALGCWRGSGVSG